jgi:putative ABC transport system permease protein
MSRESSVVHRFRLIASWAVQSLTFHRTRTVLTIAGVGLATALIISTLGFQAGYEHSLGREIDAMGYQVLVTGKGCPHEAATLILRGGSIPMYIDEQVYQLITADPAVKDSTRFFMQTIPTESGSGHQLYVGIDDHFLELKPGVRFQRGEWFSSPEAPEAILGYNVAEYRRLNLGDEIELQGRRVTVRGVLDKLGTQDDGTVFLPLTVGQTIFEKRDRLTGVGVRLHDLNQSTAFIDRLYDLPSVQVVRMSQVQSTILNLLAGVRQLLTSFGALCLLVALLGVFNVALITVHERTDEMGVMRAMGCPAGTLFALVWSETLLLSLLGATLGGVLAVALRRGTEWAVRSTLSFVPSGAVVTVTPGIFVQSCAVVVLLCLIAGAYPAWRSSLVSPMRSIRGAP